MPDKYILKQYKKWIDDAKKYWVNKINNSSASDADKSNMITQLDNYLSQFQNVVEKYKKTFTYTRFKTALVAYFAIYSFDNTDIFERYSQFKRPDVKPFTQVINYYTYILCEIGNAFSIEQETDDAGEKHYVLKLADLQKDIDNLSSINEDENVIKNIINPINDCTSDIGIVLMFKNLLYYPKKRFISFDEYCDYKIVCADFGFKIPYVT